MLGNIYLLELKRNIKSWPFVIFTLLLFAGTFYYISSTEQGVTFLYVTITKEWHNAPIVIAKLMAGYTLIGVLITMIMVGRTVTRDFSTKTHDFFFTIPMQRSSYLWGRFLGGYTANVLIFSGVIAGFFAATLLLAPEYYGPFTLRSFLYPLLFIVIPNVFFTGTIFFCLATLTRNMIMTYISGVIFFMIYVLVSIGASKIENQTVQMLMDPFGVAAMTSLTKYWTVADMNHNQMPLAGGFLFNRLIWLGISFGITIFTWKRFRFTSLLEKKRQRKKLNGVQADAIPFSVLQPLTISRISDSFGCRWKKFTSLSGREFRRVFLHPAFIILTAIAVSEMITNFLLNVADPDHMIYPFTSKYLSYTSHIWFYMVPLLILFTGVVVWRERDNGSHEIFDTMPVPDWLSFASKFFALIYILLIYITLAVLTGITIQVLVLGYTDIELGLYIKDMFGILFMKFFFLTVMFLFIQNLVSNKYLGFFIAAAYFLGDLLLFNVGKADWVLVRYGHLPDYIYSNLNGYGHYGVMLIWHSLYWFLFALVVIVLSAMLWRKGNEVNIRYRLQWALRKMRPGHWVVLGALLVMFLSTGFYLYQNRYVYNNYLSKEDEKEILANFEKKFGKYEDASQPILVHVQLGIDLMPEEREVDIRGHYILGNKTPDTISEIYVTLSDHYISSLNNMEFSREAKLESKADELGFRIFKLAEPLMPGDTISLFFDVEAHVKGFSDNNPKNEIAENGTCLMFSGSENYQYFPGIGFSNTLVLKSRQDRKKYGLQERKNAPGLLEYDPTKPYMVTSLITYDAIISTTGDQLVVSNGELAEKWTKEGRNYFHFKSDSLIHDELIIASGRYAVKSEKYDGVDIEVYYHPKHAFNVDRIIRGVKNGLDFCGSTFSPFPYQTLRVVEIPDYMKAGGARSQPTVFIWREDAGFIRNLEENDPLDDVFGIAAHELGHQWWAYMVTPAKVEGVGLITESICNYIWTMCLEREYGEDAVDKYLKRDMDRYLRGRKRDTEGERAMAYSYDRQSYLNYFKGSLVMYAMKDYLGEDSLGIALQRMVQRFSWRYDTFPSSADMIKEIRLATPDTLQYLVTDLLEKITLYENKAVSATYTQLPHGKYEVIMTLEARKYYADSIGNQTAAPMQDYIAVGVYGADKKELYLQKHLFTSDETTLTVIVDEKPLSAGIDPRVILIDKDRENNMIQL